MEDISFTVKPIDGCVLTTNLLGVLRNFGFMISKMNLYVRDLDEQLCIEIANYLVRYCSDSLQRLLFMCNTSNILFQYLPKPLPKVNTLLIQFAMSEIQTIDQIQFKLDLDKNLPNIKTLSIRYFSDAIFRKNSLKAEKMHYPNIEDFTILTYKASEYPFIFENLKHFSLKGFRFEMNDELLELIGNIKDLQTFKMAVTSLDALTPDSFRKLLELQNMQSTVVEIEIEFNEAMSSDDVLRFLNQSKKLIKFSIHLDPVYFQDSFKHFIKSISVNLSVDWKISDCYRLKINCFYVNYYSIE